MKAKVTFTTIFVITFLAVLAWQADTAKGVLITDGLVSYWSFDESDVDGITAEDGWGDNDGTMMGAFEIVDGKVGEAIELPGVQAGVDYVEMDKSDDLDPPRLTYMAWLKLNASPDYGNIVSRDDGSGIGHAMQARGATDTFRMWVVLDGVIDNAESSTSVSSRVGEWTHVAGTFDGDAIRLYIDGVLEGSKDMPGDAGCAANTQLCIGGQFGGSAGTNELINGVIDEVCVYNRALSEDEIVQNMNAEGLAVVSAADKLAITWGDIKASK
jgi:hypothetical protein